MKLRDLNENVNAIYDEVFTAYLEAVYFTEGDEGLSEDEHELSPESKKKMREDIQNFLRLAKKQIRVARQNTTLSDSEFWGQVGHDFWLTRNGHGAGFWDDPEYYGGPENADILTKIAGDMGEVTAYVGDDGMLYVE